LPAFGGRRLHGPRDVGAVPPAMLLHGLRNGFLPSGMHGVFLFVGGEPVSQLAKPQARSVKERSEQKILRGREPRG